jgi:hypothetical protein
VRGNGDLSAAIDLYLDELVEDVRELVARDELTEERWRKDLDEYRRMAPCGNELAFLERLGRERGWS